MQKKLYTLSLNCTNINDEWKIDLNVCHETTQGKLDRTPQDTGMNKDF